MASNGADVVVVGGGLAGLAAATWLAREGRHVRLLEAAEQPGGRARTRSLDGFQLNQGAHALYRGVGLELLHELGVRVEGAAPPLSGGFAVRAGRLHTLPTGPLSILATGLLSLPERFEAARLLMALPRIDRRLLQDLSLGTWLQQAVARSGVRALVETLVRLTSFAHEPERISAGAALEQLLAGARGVLYLHGGWQTLVDGLCEAARSAGVELLGRSPVVHVAVVEGGVELHLAGAARLRARAAVLALPPADVAELVPGARLPQCTPVRAACLDVALRRLPRPRRRFALGIDRPLYFSLHSAVARLAPDGRALVQLLQYLGPDAPPSPAELESLLELLQPGWREQALHVRFLPEMTVSNALVTAAAGGLRGRSDVDGLGLPNIYLAGDWVGPTGMLADASLASARRAALRLLEDSRARLSREVA